MQTNPQTIDDLEDLSEAELAQVLELEEQVESLDCKRSLAHTVKCMFPVVEAGGKENAPQYVHGWHIEAICEHLQALITGEIRNLIINIPPRHMKSTIISVIFPAWVWVKNPSFKFLFASYAQSLSTRDALKCRTLIESPEYQKVFRPEWRLADDQNTKTRYNTTEGGFRFSSSVGGSVTGEGGDIIVIDDAHNAVEIESETKRQGVLDWWDVAMSSRLNDPKTGRKLVVMQRLHEKDLVGHLLSHGGWEHLKLPAEYEVPKSGTKKQTKIGFSDPRETEGELLWPDRFGPQEILDLKKMGARAAAAQLQQDPTPATAALFKRSFWKFYDKAPEKFIRIIQFWDCAQKPGVTNDFSVCATWGETMDGLYLLDRFKDRLAFPGLMAACKTQFAKWLPQAVVIEDKSSGISLIQMIEHDSTVRIPVIKFNPGQNDKVVRASAATPTIEGGTVYLPANAEFTEDFLTEHEKFPNGEHDDQVDTTSMAIDFFGAPRPQPSITLL